MNNILLSIIVPVYNGEATIQRCIESLIFQNYRSLEIIIVNDGSTDNSEGKIKELIESYPNTRIVLVNKRNKGLPLARKTGIDIARGEYIGFVDSDDWVEKTMYQKMMETAFENNSDIVCCDMAYDFETRSVKKVQKCENRTWSQEETMYLLNNRIAIFTSLCNKIIKKNVIFKSKFSIRNIVGEDYDVTLQCILNSSKITTINHLGYHYIQTGSSMVHSGFTDSYRYGFYNYLRLNKIFYLSYPMYLKDFENFLLVEYLGVITSMCISKKEDYKVIKYIKKFVRAHLISFLVNRHNTIYQKISALLFELNYRLFSVIYRILNQIK